MKKRVLGVFLFYLIVFIPSLLVSASSVGLNESSQWHSNLTPVRWSASAFGDVDSNGYSDLVVIGCLSGTGGDHCNTGTVSKVYLNNGTTFTENQTWQQNLTPVGWGSLVLGDINNDGMIDAIYSGCTTATESTPICNGDYVSKVYLNNGTAFAENQTWQQNLTKAFYGSLATGDIDRDGDLDLIMIGSTAVANSMIKVYLNNGTAFAENQTWQQNLTAVTEGQIFLGDVDNDGDLDLALTGDLGTNIDFTNFYVNNGSGFLESAQWNTNLVYMDRSSLVWGDYNNDAYPDLMICGHTTGDHCYLYKNNRTSLELNQTDNNALPGIYRATIAFGDYDNDGDLDFIGAGHEGDLTKVLGNNQSNDYYFQNDAIAHSNISDYLYEGNVIWSDVNNDSRLDLLISGLNFITGSITYKVFLNNGTTNNTQPQPPNSSFSAIYQNGLLNLNWGNGSDNETTTTGIYYNIRIGVSGNKNSVISGVYGGSSGGGGGGGGSNGYFGNMMQRKSIALSNARLQNGTTYFWSVQTIDTGLMKSAWSEEQNFTLTSDIAAPTITINFPSDPNYTSFSNVTFSVNVSDNVNVTNVSLYGSWGNWHRNQTNSSGLNGTEYVFQANLSAYAEGTYTWAIHACDTTGNCIFTGNRTLFRDLNAPQPYLEYPANSTNWVDNSTVVFKFNVTDLAIVNCSFILNSTVNYTFSSVTVNTSFNYTLALENGYYNWSINCTDNLNRVNSSGARNITINYVTPPSSSSSGGGGGGSGTSFITHNAGNIDNKERGINRELKKEDRIKFNVSQEAHVLLAKLITTGSASFELNSTPLLFTLIVGETKKFNLTSYLAHDLAVTLNKISENRANVTLTAITEIIPQQEEKTEEKNITSTEDSELQEIKEQREKENPQYFIFLSVLALGAVAVFITLKMVRGRGQSLRP